MVDNFCFVMFNVRHKDANEENLRNSSSSYQTIKTIHSGDDFASNRLMTLTLSICVTPATLMMTDFNEIHNLHFLPSHPQRDPIKICINIMADNLKELFVVHIIY